MGRRYPGYDIDMSKLIVYLDQNFVSNMAKAKFLGAPVLAEKTAPYGLRYDRLKFLVERDIAICPGSLFHQVESEVHRLVGATETVVTKLSFGLNFRTPWEVVASQARRALRDFLGLPREQGPNWVGVFNHDPHEPVDLRTIQIGKGRAIMTSPWPNVDGTVKPTAYMNDRRAALGKFIWKDLPTRRKHQENGVIDAVFVHPQDSNCRLAAAALVDNWSLIGAPLEKFQDFLRSPELRSCEFISILSTLTAAVECYSTREPKPGDACDSLILATVLPYCDVIATSSDLVELWQQTGLKTKFKAQVYGARTPQLKAFDEWLVAASREGIKDSILTAPA